MSEQVLHTVGLAGAAIVVVTLVTWTVRGGRRRRRVRAAPAWQSLTTQAAVHPLAQVCVVERVYQHARRGSKAVIVWVATGRRQDAWFWSYHPVAGSTLLVAGGSSYGPHNRNPHVFYIEPGGIIAAAPPGAWHAYQLTQAAGGHR